MFSKSDQGVRTVSIVIIAKNEEINIGAAIESVIKTTASYKNVEILLIDSNSTDRTITIAKQYPITIYQLKSTWRHTPAAGRYIGQLKSSGEFILFLDGDSQLQEGFLEQAVAFFQEDVMLAAIVGRRSEIYRVGDKIIGEHQDINEIGTKPRFLESAPGSAIYRRSALDKAGGFNPYLFSEEEGELGRRIRMNQFRILGIPIPFVVHNTFPRGTVRTFFFQRLGRNFHLGPGQILRYHLWSTEFTAILSTMKKQLGFMALVAAGVMSLAMYLLNYTNIFILCWLGIVALLLLAFIVKSRSTSKPFKYCLIWTIQSYALVKGFLLPPHDPSNYPTDPIRLQ